MSRRSINPPSRLELLRRQARLSQAEVAGKLGVARSLVSMMESGERDVDQYAGGLAELYGVPRAELEEAAAEARNGNDRQ